MTRITCQIIKECIPTYSKLFCISIVVLMMRNVCAMLEREKTRGAHYDLVKGVLLICIMDRIYGLGRGGGEIVRESEVTFPEGVRNHGVSGRREVSQNDEV